MDPRPFVHLHCHSEFSLADGAIRIKDLIKKAKTWNQTAIALTDHGNMFGAVAFYSDAKKDGVKPILGAEIYLEPDPRLLALLKTLKDRIPMIHAGWQIPHLVLLAKNQEGHGRLMKILSKGYWEGLNEEDIPVVPRQAFWELADRESMFALSAAGVGELGMLLRILNHLRPQWWEQEDLARWDETSLEVYELCQDLAQQYQSFFGDAFFLELQDNGLSWQKDFNAASIRLAKKNGIPLVATGNAHYIDQEFSESHAILLAVKAGITMSSVSKRDRTADFHLRSPEEMWELFADVPEALTNTVLIADQCQVKIEFGVYHLPQYTVAGETSDETLRRLSREGLDERFVYLSKLYGPSFDDAAKTQYRERLEYELDMIIKMGFPGYFLIVQDFINWAKNNDIPVGPGRGSGAGSLVAYALRIIDLDPIRNQLIFERFLNPERVSMPDFDVDFCQDRREEVIRYVVRKYGAENVAQIITFGEMKAKAALKNVGRAMGLGYNRVDRFTKLIPPELNITLKDASEKEPRILEALKADEELATMWEVALKLEGLKSHTSVHAAGVVISDKPMVEYIPIYKVKGDESLITQYEMKNVEKVGLVKFDFLGLKTLTVIKKAVDIIKASKDPNFDISLIPIDDKKVYDLISTGKTTGIFQLEGSGMQNLVVKLKPSRFEDIIALVALFRPGPLGSGMVDDFIDRKHGRAALSYPHPLTADILEETYGVILYQEQVQKIAVVLANYTLGEADLLRRAMGKKNPAEMQQQRSRFMEGATANQIDEKLSGEIFDLMAKFAEYGFNKSHSAAYGLVSYQTAYLKTHFPDEFMTAILTCDMGNTEKVTKYIDDCRRMGIAVLPPDINHSTIEFQVAGVKGKNGGAIRYGLGAIKGIGNSAVLGLIEERAKKGPYKSLGDLAKRVNLNDLGKKNLEVLTMAGALDLFHIGRQAVMQAIPQMVDYSVDCFSAQQLGQRGLFDVFAEPQAIEQDSSQKEGWEPNLNQALSLGIPSFNELVQEKKLTGHFLSLHPLSLYRADIEMFGHYKLAQLGNPNLLKVGERKQDVRLVAIVTDVFERLLKSGTRAAILRLEDLTGPFETIMFERDYQDSGLPKVDEMIVLKGSLERRMPEAPARYVAKSFELLHDYREEHIEGLDIKVKAQQLKTDQIDHLMRALERFPGEVPVRTTLLFSQGKVEFAEPVAKVALHEDLLRTAISLDCELKYSRHLD